MDLYRTLDLTFIQWTVPISKVISNER